MGLVPACFEGGAQRCTASPIMISRRAITISKTVWTSGEVVLERTARARAVYAPRENPNRPVLCYRLLNHGHGRLTYFITFIVVLHQEFIATHHYFRLAQRGSGAKREHTESLTRPSRKQGAMCMMRMRNHARREGVYVQS